MQHTVQIGNLVIKRVEVKAKSGQLTLSHPAFIDLRFVNPEVGMIIIREEFSSGSTIYTNCVLLNSEFSGMELIFETDTYEIKVGSATKSRIGTDGN